MATTAPSVVPDEDIGHSEENPVVNVIQDGARLHYALPVALQRRGILGAVFTDWFLSPGSREDRIARLAGRFAPDLGKRLAGRCCPELDSSRVIASYGRALDRWLVGTTPGPPEKRDARLSTSFSRWVGRQRWPPANAMIGFVRNIDPELCALAKKRRLFTVVDQMIAPASIQAAETHRQVARWSDWGGSVASPNLDFLIEIERRTWALADHITCPSAYVREGLLQQGIASDKISVIPYPIDNARFPFVDRSARKGPLIVGFLGAVGLRKGAPAFMEVARCFDSSKARFLMVGPVEVEPTVLAAHKGLVELTGPVPRSEVFSWLERFDLLLFPSTCEGSAGAVMEAMATGLPVITTANSGTVVRDGIEGFICACDNIAAFAQHVERLRNDRALRTRMGTAARERIEDFNLDGYGKSLDRLFRELIIPANQTGPERETPLRIRTTVSRNSPGANGGN